MAGQRQPTELVIAKGRKHLTKAEIEKRRNTEVQPLRETIEPPSCLKAKQKKEFLKVYGQLDKLKIFSATDVDALTRYIKARDLYIAMTKIVERKNVQEDPDLMEKYSKLQDRYFKQCRSCANDMGLTISSRCRLVVPEPPKKEKKNKFEKFENTNGEV